MAVKEYSLVNDLEDIINTANEKGNVTERNAFVLYGRIVQARSDGRLSIAESKALRQKIDFDFSKYDDELQVAFTGLTGGQLDSLPDNA